MNPQNIAGTSKTHVRRQHDFYPTPHEVTRALLDFLHIPTNHKIWECACGQDHMASVMREYGYDVIGTDISRGEDFFEIDCPPDVDWIITNPPFSASEQFIGRCVHHGIPFALLLKSQYWHASRRLNIFEEHPPAFVLPLTWRPDFTGQGASLMDVMWCVWDGNCRKCLTIYKPLARPAKH